MVIMCITDSSPPTMNRLVESVSVDIDDAIDSKLAQLPTKLLAEIQQHELRRRSYMTHLETKVHPCSLLNEIQQHENAQPTFLTHVHTKVPLNLLSEIRDYQNQEQQKGNQNEILDIVCDMLTVAAKDCEQNVDDDCGFISPSMKKSIIMSVNKSQLAALSLDEDSDDELEDDEDHESQKENTEPTTSSETEPSASASPQKSPKKVWFNPRTSINLTMTREEMTEAEKKDYWLQDEEFALIRMRDGYLGNLVEQKHREIEAGVESDSYIITPSSIAISPQHWICTRGLEFKMTLGFLRTKDRRLRCLEQVLTEQERQWDEHWDEGRNLTPFVYDFESLALVSLEVSTECRFHAQKVGANDRRDVEEALRMEAQEEESLPEESKE